MLAIVYEGCGCRAAFHAGVTEALAAGGITPTLALGASSGSLCAAAVAKGRGADLATIWSTFSGRSVLSMKRLRKNRSPFDMGTILREGIAGFLGAGDLRDAPGEAIVTATRLPDFARRVYSSRDESDFTPALLGSCFVPLIYGNYIRHRGELLVDGGVVDNLPIELAAERGATDIICVTPRPSGLAIKTPRRRAWKPRLPAGATARLHVIHPAEPLQIASWDLDRDRMLHAIDAGRAAGLRFLATVPQLGAD